jgi:hypothetical protein
MALATGFMKEMSGVLGDVAIMHRGNKTFIKCRPKRSKNPLTELAITKQINFGIGGKIAGAISSFAEIKKLWAAEPERNRTGYNRMFQANHGHFNIDDLTGKIVMSDGGGLEVLNASLEIGDAGVQIKCDWFGSKDRIKPEREKYIMAAGIIPMINPLIHITAPVFQIMKFKTENIPIAAGEKFSAEIIYQGGDLVKFSDYRMKRAFAVLITLDENLNPVDISETIGSVVDRKNIPVDTEKEMAGGEEESVAVIEEELLH